jgi:putative ABC transport system permease protein
VDADVWSNELLKHPAIKSVALISNPPWVNSYSGLYGLLPMGSSSIVNTTVTNVSYGFEAALDLTVRAGRTFSEEFGDAERSAAAPEPVVIDVTLARQLGYRQPTEAIGKIIKRGGFAGGEVAIIGVVADQPMRLQPALDWVGTLYAPNKSNTGIPAVRIDKSQVAEGVAWIDATWRKLAPGIPIEKGFTDDAFAKAYKIYALIASVLSTVAIITLSIALLGAFGFVMFVSNRRSHEIAIRKTLGASAKQIFAMILRDFSRPIVVANILGWPLAYIAAQRYLSTFEQRVDVTPWYFIAGLAFTLVIAWLAISHQTWRAARLKPAEVLRHE